MWGNEVSQQPTMCLMNVCTVGTNKPHSRSNTRRKFTFSLFICTNYKTKNKNNTLQTTNNTTAPACICGGVVVDLSAQSASYFFWFLETQTCSQDQLPVCQTWTRTCCQSLTPVVYSNHSSSLPLPLPLPAYSPTTLESTFSLLMTLNVKSVLILLSSCLLTTKSSFSHYYQMIFLRFWFCYERCCCWFYWTVCVIVQSHSEYMLHS